jgi:hypothetical protein
LRNGELTTLTENKNKGLSIVVTTLILLVVGVLLAAVVAYYATNITTTRTNTEEVRISSPHVWVNSTGAVAAFKVQNIGGKDILLYKIAVRSVEATWTQVYIYRVPTTTRVSNDVNVTSYDLITGANFTLDGRTYSQITSDVPLISGAVLLVYVKGPSNIQMDDIGTTVDVGVTTNNAQYLTECNVRSCTYQ